MIDCGVGTYYTGKTKKGGELSWGSPAAWGSPQAPLSWGSPARCPSAGMPPEAPPVCWLKRSGICHPRATTQPKAANPRPRSISTQPAADDTNGPEPLLLSRGPTPGAVDPSPNAATGEAQGLGGSHTVQAATFAPLLSSAEAEPLARPSLPARAADPLILANKPVSCRKQEKALLAVLPPPECGS